MSTANLASFENATQSPDELGEDGIRVFPNINQGKLIVTVGCSTGERYLSTDLGEQARKEVGA